MCVNSQKLSKDDWIKHDKSGNLEESKLYNFDRTWNPDSVKNSEESILKRKIVE